MDYNFWIVTFLVAAIVLFSITNWVEWYHEKYGGSPDTNAAFIPGILALLSLSGSVGLLIFKILLVIWKTKV